MKSSALSLTPLPATQQTLARYASPLAALLILLAFATALRATRGISWPCEIDFFRDMGASQSVFDGRLFEDPSYRGESSWYNPLVPGLVGIGSKVTGIPLPLFYARVGPVLNIFGPIFFFLVVGAVYGRALAVAALTGYLFWSDPNFPSWFQGTYSPWAWPMNVAQGIAFATLYAIVRAVSEGGRRWQLAAGLLLGCTFLAHAAPAFLIALTLVLYTVISLRRGTEPPYQAVTRLAVIGGTSFLVASPFISSLYLNYGLIVRNYAPMRFFVPTLGAMVLSFVSIRTIGAVLGGWVLLRTGPRGPRGLFASCFGVVTITCFFYGLSAHLLDRAANIYLPLLFPPYHFALYTRVIASTLWGAGILALVEGVERLLARPSLASLRRFLPLNVRVLPAAIIVAVVILRLPWYLRGQDFTLFVEMAKQHQSHEDRTSLYRWILASTDPNDVFLADSELGLPTAVAAGRKVVALPLIYSNPYVDYDERVEDREAMIAALAQWDRCAFGHLAQSYNIRFILFGDEGSLRRNTPEEVGALLFGQEVFAKGGLRLYQLSRDFSMCRSS